MVLISIIVSVSSMYKSHLYPSIEISLRILSLFPRNANLRLLIEEAIILFASARLSRTTPLVVSAAYRLNGISDLPVVGRRRTSHPLRSTKLLSLHEEGT